MLTIEIPQGEEAYDEASQKFFYPHTVKINMEHSLVSLSKWESRFEKSFLNTSEKTIEEVVYYMECMLVGDTPKSVLQALTEDNLKSINNYIEAAMTGTKFFGKEPPEARPQTVTAELIYYWMITYNIPVEFQHWHLNRLMTLIKVCVQKNAPAKKMSPAEQAAEQRELNRRRKEQYGIQG